jgi:hypothetical protein
MSQDFKWKSKDGFISVKDMTTNHLKNVQNQLLHLDFTLYDTLSIKEVICARDCVDSKVLKKLNQKNYFIKALQEITLELINRGN